MVTGSDLSAFGPDASFSVPATQGFWDALREGRLVIQRCNACGHLQWTPQLACRSCLSEHVAWAETAGTGTLYSATTIHRSPDESRWPAPYTVAVVVLDEGPHLLTRLAVAPGRRIPIGSRVKVVFSPGGDEDPGPVVYEFAPIEKDADGPS